MANVEVAIWAALGAIVIALAEIFRHFQIKGKLPPSTKTRDYYIAETVAVVIAVILAILFAESPAIGAFGVGLTAPLLVTKLARFFS